jgi:hypothetical protein
MLSWLVGGTLLFTIFRNSLLPASTAPKTFTELRYTTPHGAAGDAGLEPWQKQVRE